VDARPVPSETEIHREFVQLSTNRERRTAIGHEPRRVSRIGLYRVGDDAALVEKRLQYGSRNGTNARGTAGIGGVKRRGLRIGLRQKIGAILGFAAIEGFRFQEVIMQGLVGHEILLPVGRADGVSDRRGEECLHMGQPEGGTRRALGFAHEGPAQKDCRF